MTTKRKRVMVKVPLDYRVGTDEPERGIYRNSVALPKHTRELTVTFEELADHPAVANDPDFDVRPQVHIVGTARALEELGRYLIGLARLKTADPEPYGALEDVANGPGGTLRLLPRRVSLVRSPARTRKLVR